MRNAIALTTMACLLIGASAPARTQDREGTLKKAKESGTFTIGYRESSLPLSYLGALDEAREVRRRAGVFDVSHIGRIRIRGNGALDLLEHVCTADVTRQEDNTAQSTLLCNAAGGILDAGFIVRLETFWVLTTSPGNREKVLNHLQPFADEFGAKVDDQTFKTCQLAVTGPAAATVLDTVLPEKVSTLPSHTAKMGSLLLADVGKGYLVVAGDPTTNAGMLRMEVDRAAAALREVFGTKLAASAADNATGRSASA